jgi:tetratricopeptide (TPR) repeat protein
MTRYNHLFISYAHADRDVALKISKALKKSGIEVWIDKSIVGGQVWTSDITRAIRTARAILLVASSRSLTRPIVKKEIFYAVDENKPIVPVFIEEAKIPDDLKLHLSGLHFMYINKLLPQDQIPNILQALKQLGFDVIERYWRIAEVNHISDINKRFIEPSYFDLLKMSSAEVRKKISEFTTILEAKPDHGYVYLNLGLIYLFLKNYNTAEQCLRKALEFIPDEPDVYYYLSITLCGGHRLGSLRMPIIKQIEEYLKTAIQLDDTKEVYYYMLAFVYHEYYAVNGLRIPGPDPFDLIEMHEVQDNEEIERLLDTVNVKSEVLISQIRSQ